MVPARWGLLAAPFRLELPSWSLLRASTAYTQMGGFGRRQKVALTHLLLDGVMELLLHFLSGRGLTKGELSVRVV